MFQEYNTLTPKQPIPQVNQIASQDCEREDDISMDDEPEPQYKPGERLRDQILKQTKKQKTKTKSKDIKVDKSLQEKLSRQMKNLII